MANITEQQQVKQFGIEAKKAGEIYSVPLKSLWIDPNWNPRRNFDPKHLEQLENLFSVHGWLPSEPILVRDITKLSTLTEEQRAKLSAEQKKALEKERVPSPIKGGTRLMVAANMLKAGKITEDWPVYVQVAERGMSESELEDLDIISNVHKEFSKAEIGLQALKQKRKGSKYTNAFLAKQWGLTEQEIGQCLKLAKEAGYLAEKSAQGIVPFAVAYSILKASERDQDQTGTDKDAAQEIRLEQYLAAEDKKSTAKEIIALLQARLQGRLKTTNPPSLESIREYGEIYNAFTEEEKKAWGAAEKGLQEAEALKTAAISPDEDLLNTLEGWSEIITNSSSQEEGKGYVVSSSNIERASRMKEIFAEWLEGQDEETQQKYAKTETIALNPDHPLFSQLGEEFAANYYAQRAFLEQLANQQEAAKKGKKNRKTAESKLGEMFDAVWKESQEALKDSQDIKWDVLEFRPQQHNWQYLSEALKLKWENYFLKHAEVHGNNAFSAQPSTTQGSSPNSQEKPQDDKVLEVKYGSLLKALNTAMEKAGYIPGQGMEGLAKDIKEDESQLFKAAYLLGILHQAGYPTGGDAHYLFSL